MNHRQYRENHSRLCDKMEELTEKKQKDYCGNKDDPFYNVSRVERNGLCSTEIGIMTRLNDKLARLEAFVKSGFLNVSDESVEDTCVDGANYLIMLALYCKKKQKPAFDVLDAPSTDRMEVLKIPTQYSETD